MNHSGMQGSLALVTGASGFIGSEVIRQLAARGFRVRALLRSTSSRANLQGVDFDVAEGDMRDFESLKQAVAGVDYVFHIAGVISARRREDYFGPNAQGTGLLARACAEVNPKLKRFLYVSSLAASGPSTSLQLRREDDEERPASVYGESKLEGERELARAAKYSFTVIRPPVVYGPRDRGMFEFFKLVSRGIAPVFPANNEHGQKFYSLVHVHDLVNGIVHGGLAENQGERETFFLSGDGVHSWAEVMSEIAQGVGKKPLKLALPSFAWTGLAAVYTGLATLSGRDFPLTLDKLHDLRPDFWICSNERAKQKLGFHPQFNLREGIAQTVQWYKQHGWL